MRRRNAFGELDMQDAYAAVAETFPKTGIWSQNQQLGGVLQNPQTEVQGVGPGPPVVRQVPIGVNTMLLKMDEWWMPHVWSLSLWARSKEVPPDNGAVVTTEVAVNFGVGGAMQTVEVDFVRGTVLSFPTNSISVKILKASPLSEIFAQVALGTRGQCGCPQRKIFKNLFVGAVSDSALFLLPAFTHEVVVSGGFPNGNVLDPLVFVEFSDRLISPPTISQSTPLSVVTTAYGGKISIPSDAVSMQIRSASAVDVQLNAHARLGL